MSIFKKILNRAKIWRDFFLDLLFPTECIGCGQEGEILCGYCFKKIKINFNHYCLNCKNKNNFGEFCPECRNKFYLNGVWIAGNYKDKLLSRAIKTYKYKFFKNLNVRLGDFTSLFLRNLINKNKFNRNNLDKGLAWKDLQKIKNFPTTLLNLSASILVPVPIHKKRLRWRGFNQSELLAEIIGKNFNIAISKDLARIKYAKPQAKLNKEKRESSLKDSFVWKGNNLKNKNIILIDDVVTTGATLNECAKILKQNGANEVWGLVIAHG